MSGTAQGSQAGTLLWEAAFGCRVPLDTSTVGCNSLITIALYRKLPCVKPLLMHNGGSLLKGTFANPPSLFVSVWSLQCYRI